MSESFLLRTKVGLALLLVGLFLVNYAETQLEELVKTPDQYAQGFLNARAFQELEGEIVLNGQSRTPILSIIGFSFSYFALLPLLLLGNAAAAWRRPSIRPARIFTFSLIINYLLSLPFFLFFPVPERWAYPESGTILLSDLLSTRLIELIRPISGLDNCFPSVHVSFSILAILTGYWFKTRWRHCILLLGLTVVLSTFALGIHWIPDVVLGIAMGGLGFALAIFADRRLTDVQLPRVEPRRLSGFSPARNNRHLAFISYRREQGSEVARIVQSELARRGISCFLDVKDLKAEHFDNRLLNEIEQAPNFILVLAPNSLGRCNNDDDWLRREIAHALMHRKHIIPLLLNNFQFPPGHQLPEEIRGVERHNGVTYSHEYFEATFDKLQSFLKTER
ncbi:MAG: TIR domain-containing protein [Methylococcaceae bacterium]|nr:TIR domain-containing protein [Methylococcaceae bacterium]